MPRNDTEPMPCEDMSCECLECRVFAESIQLPFRPCYGESGSCPKCLSAHYGRARFNIVMSERNERTQG